MKSSPSLKIHVVGRTDNVGTFAHNMDLSRRRASSVAQTLSARYAIDASRMHAEGVGPFSPGAANHTEEGRAKNRRVELVEQ